MLLLISEKLLRPIPGACNEPVASHIVRFEAHQQQACEVLDFHWLSEAQRRALSGALRLELARTRDRQQLLIFARRWLYEHRLLIMHERSIRSTIVKARRQYEVALAKSIHAAIDEERLERWGKVLVSEDEMQAVADALNLLANIVMAWNTAKMRSTFDRWARRRNGEIPPKLIAQCAPTRTEGLNMRGICRFPIELYVQQLLPSWVSPEIQLLEPEICAGDARKAVFCELPERSMPSLPPPRGAGASR